MGSSQRSKKGSKRNNASRGQKLYRANKRKLQRTDTIVSSAPETLPMQFDHTYARYDVSNLNHTSGIDAEKISETANMNIASTSNLTQNVAVNNGDDIDMDNCWGTNEELESIMNHPLEIEIIKEDINIEGNRIVNLGYVLKWALKLQRNHSQICTSGNLYLWKETRNGLVSSLFFKCTMCTRVIMKTTEPQKETAEEYDINVGTVWGTLSTGSCHSHLEEFCSLLNMPSMTFRKFSEIENSLANCWHDNMVDEFVEAGKQEAQIARDSGNVDSDGIPFITVYLDGGWSKRSYGHNYDAASGAAIIIGKATKKVLFVGVRNKFCYVCAKAINNKQQPNQHKCFRNWNGSSSAMEADIIVEGFNKSIEMHGIRYKFFIADGDSSTYAHIKTKVIYGQCVMKIECKNHALKNYSKHLYAVKDDKRISCSKKVLTTINIKKLVDHAKHNVAHNSHHGTTDELKKDLANGPYHIFGHHDNCLSYYCEKQTQNNNQVPELKGAGLFQHIEGAVENLIKKAHMLQDNETNNRAELFMSLLAKYNAGKRLNLTMRGSFQTRCQLASLTYNKGATWHATAWKSAQKKSPGSHFKKYIKKKVHLQAYRNGINKKSKCRKSLFNVKTTTVNNDYGIKAVQPDLDEDDLQSECERVMSKLQVTAAERDSIQKNSVGQFGNAVYETERSNRLTASLFGKIVKRRSWTPCHVDVKSILYSSNFSNNAIEYGKINEQVAISKFEQQFNLQVQPSGLFVYLQHGFLGASPDGLIGEDGLVEVKCLYSVFKSGKSLEEAAKGNICLEMQNGCLRLKKSHNYYYQIQGQLNITQRDYCFFVVYVDDKHDLFVEKIYRDSKFWKEDVLPLLVDFYKENVAPEIVQRRIPKGLRCTNSKCIQDAIKKRNK